MKPNQKKMTVSFEYKVDLFSQAQEFVISFAGRVGNSISKLPWFFALLILFIVGFLYTLIAYLPLYFSRMAIKNLTNSLIRNIDGFDERAAMLVHADIEEIRKKLEKNARAVKGFFVFKPLANQIAKTTFHYRRLEVALFKVAYPNYNQKLTKEQEIELVKAFAVWKDDEEDKHELNIKAY